MLVLALRWLATFFTALADVVEFVGEPKPVQTVRQSPT